MSNFKFNCGETLKDKVTGAQGVCVCRLDYLTGCNRYALQQKVKKDGTIPEWIYCDENILVKVNTIKKINPEKSDDNGGYKPDNAQRKN
jgi:hypothetical protein